MENPELLARYLKELVEIGFAHKLRTKLKAQADKTADRIVDQTVKELTDTLMLTLETERRPEFRDLLLKIVVEDRRAT